MNINHQSVIEVEDHNLTEYCGKDTVFKTMNMLCEISKKLTGNKELQQQWVEGVNCSVLIPGNQWQKGKIKLSFYFVPEGSTEETATNGSPSPLDDIRQNSGS